jgi:hypothetical protein
MGDWLVLQVKFERFDLDTSNMDGCDVHALALAGQAGTGGAPAATPTTTVDDIQPSAQEESYIGATFRAPDPADELELEAGALYLIDHVYTHVCSTEQVDGKWLDGGMTVVVFHRESGGAREELAFVDVLPLMCT